MHAPAYARALLDLVREAKIAKTDVSAFHARQIQEFNDPELNKQLVEVWGEVRTSTAEKRALIDRFKSEITPATLTQAQPGQGLRAFSEELRNCHVLYGVGRKVGPDLTGSNRKNLDYLLKTSSIPVPVSVPISQLGRGSRRWPRA